MAVPDFEGARLIINRRPWREFGAGNRERDGRSRRSKVGIGTRSGAIQWEAFIGEPSCRSQCSLPRVRAVTVASAAPPVRASCVVLVSKAARCRGESAGGIMINAQRYGGRRHPIASGLECELRSYADGSL